MRIGVDLGGTKIEALALDNAGVELVRERVSTGWGFRGRCGLQSRACCRAW